MQQFLIPMAVLGLLVVGTSTSQAAHNQAAPILSVETAGLSSVVGTSALSPSACQLAGHGCGPSYYRPSYHHHPRSYYHRGPSYHRAYYPSYGGHYQGQRHGYHGYPGYYGYPGYPGGRYGASIYLRF